MTVGRARTMAEPRRARDGAAPGDPARLLDVDRLAAGSIFALFSLTMLAFVVNTGPMSQTPWGLTAAAALIAAAGLVIAPGPDRLTSTRLVAILALTAYCNVAMVWQFTPAEWPGWASWNFGMTALVMIGVAFRGRILWSWAGIALMAAVAISWSTITAGSPVLGVELSYMHVAINVPVTFFAIGMRRSAHAIAQLQEVEHRRAVESAADEARAEERERELARVRAVVAEPLRDIADGTTTRSPTDLLVLEARLRDRIRGRALEAPRLRASVDAARRRGITVLLLDDAAAPAPDDWLFEGLAEAAEVLDSQPDGMMTVRLSGGPETWQLTVVANGTLTTRTRREHVAS
tara:strand:+ start:652 stop:1695 length:1044 start_codon:yes stop_codon:yes gene_type:complete